MAHEIIDVDWLEEIRHQDLIIGRLVSGHRFKGKVFSCGKDYIAIVRLEIEDGLSGYSPEPDMDIVRMRLDSIMYFDKIESA